MMEDNDKFIREYIEKLRKSWIKKAVSKDNAPKVHKINGLREIIRILEAYLEDKAQAKMYREHMESKER